MKDNIIKIAEDLKQGTITETKARTLLLGLFGVINQVCSHFGVAKEEGDEIHYYCNKCGKRL